MLKDIEKLLKKPIPRREHDFPMEVFEAPKDAKGRPVNAEDAEARQAARERNAAHRKQAAEKKAAEQQKAAAQAQVQAKAEPATEKKSRKAKAKAEPTPAPAAPEKKEKVRRTYPHGKQERTDLQAFLDAQPDADDPIYMNHRDPLKGEVIMDATARLLASKPVYRYYKPKPAEQPKEQRREKNRRRSKRKEAPAEVSTKAPQAAKPAQSRQAPKKGIPAPLMKQSKGRRDRGRGRIPPRVEPPRNQQKDSTEQKSLMKPFYISHD